MPIDPNIVAALAPTQGQQASLGTFAQMQTAAENLRKAADEKRKEQEIRSILSSGDYDRAIDTLNQRGYVDYATKVRQQLDAHRKSVDDTFLNDLKKDEAQTALLTKVAQGVRDQATLETARSIFSQFSEEGQKLAGLLPETWDDAASSKMQQFVDMGLTAEQHSQRQQKSYEKLMSGDWDKGTAELLATADTPEDAQGVMAALAARHAPKALLDQFAPMVAQWSPEMQKKVADMALTEKDRREFVAKEATAQASAANTAADNARADAAARRDQARLGLETRRVALAEQEAKRVAAGDGTAGVKLSVGQQNDLADMLTLRDMAADVETLGNEIKWSGVGGMLSGSANQFMARNFGRGTSKEQDLRNGIANITATIAKLRGGTAFTPNEQRLLEQYTPTIDDDKLVIQSKLKSLKQYLETKRKNIIGVASGAASAGETDKGGGKFSVSYKGKTYSFTSQEQLDGFKREVGIK